ncbi:MAG: hypothetical protein LBG10_02010 [Treponema sp.]|jgi:hypothetical protein|nr:hypothetical protein [Treponema sp.]
MIQFYFLSILLNGLTGYILGFGGDEHDGSIEASVKPSLNNGTFRLILGILTALTGLLKLLSPTEGDIPVIGDLIPALLGLGAGFILLFGYYRERSTVDSENVNRAAEALFRHKRWMGFVLLGSAILHFLFPKALFL